MSGPTRPDAGTGNAFHGKRTIKKDLTVPWVATQHRTFTRWSNIFLAQHPTSPTTINGLVNPNDLHTGINLILLLESLSGKEILKNPAERKAALKPSRFQYLDNATKALNFVRQEGIRLVNIGSTDIVDSNLTPTLGLMWSLILHYQITSSVEPSSGGPSTAGAPAKDEEKKTAAKQELLNWVNSKIEPLGGPHVNNFGRDWNDGVALCALNEALAPGSMGEDNVASAKKRAATEDGKKQNGKLALETAVHELEIPKLLDVDDLITNEPDELSVMTLVGVYRMADGKPKGEKMKTIRPKKNKDASPPAPVVEDDGEAKRKEAEEAERKRKEAEEAERKRKEAEEAERKRKEAEDVERRRREAEEADRRRKEAEEADRRRRDAEKLERKRREAEEADRKRREAEDAAAAAERKRREAEEAASAAERRRIEEEQALKAVAEERRRKEEEKRRQDEEDAKRKRLEEEEAMRRRREEEERALREKREREEAELKRKREEEDRRRKEEDERKKYDEEERKRREDEAKRKRDEEDRKRQEEEDRRKREEDEKRRRDDDELRRRREEEEEARRKRRDEEEAERTRRRLEEEAERKRRDDEESAKRKRDEDARKRQAEVEAEARRREEEEEKEVRRKKNEEKRKKAAEAEAKRLKELEEAANKKSDNEHSDDDNSSEEGGGTHIFAAPVSENNEAPDKFKNRRGGCFVCEVNKPYGRKQGSLLMRGYLPNHPFYPGGNIEIETEILQEAKDARVMTDAGREMKVWVETTQGVFGKRQVNQLEDKELRPMGLDIFRDARFTWKLPDDLALTKGKKGKIKHSLCMDIISNDKKKVLKFRWPIEEVSNSKSVIHRNTGGKTEPPKAGSVGALLAERKAGSSASSSPAMSKPSPLVKPSPPAAAQKKESESSGSSESSGTHSESSGERKKKRSGSSGSSDSRESSAESSDTSSGTESD